MTNALGAANNRPKLPRGAVALQQALKQRRWSQNELARCLGIASGAVSRWASGQRVPDLASAVLLQKELGISVELWLRP